MKTTFQRMELGCGTEIAQEILKGGQTMEAAFLYSRRRRPKGRFAMAGFARAASTPVVLGQSVRRVKGDPTGTRNGATRNDAFTFLDDALGAAVAEDEIWIAGGHYKPDRQTQNSKLSFELVSSAAMPGGFVGGQSQREQRVWRKNETAFAGEINGCDAPQDSTAQCHCCLARLGALRFRVMDR